MSSNEAFFASDTHFDHKNICKYRTQFKSVDEHNQFVMQRLLAPAGRKHTLWLLGDTCFSQESVRFLRELKEAYGHLRLVLGNHCTENTERQEIIREIAVDQIAPIHSLVSYDGMWLSHAPIHPGELRGKLNVHGHSHDRASTGDPENYQCVSLEQIDFKPITKRELRERFVSRYIWTPGE